MASRSRQSAATPGRSRIQNEAPTTTAAARPREATIPLPAYEAPLAPLTAKAQQELENILQRTYPSRKIEEQLKRAASAIEESTGEINDRLMEKETQMKKRKARREKDGIEDMELDEKENEDLEATKKKIEAMTDRMDIAVRKCIDGEAGLTSLEKSVKELHRSAATAAQQAQAQRQTQQPTQSQPNNTPQNTEEDPQVTQPGGSTARTQSQQPSTPAPPALITHLNTALQAHTDAYTAQSLRTRYSEHPSYISFKRTTWDAQHPGDEAPPLPHPSTWFVKEERGASPPPGTTNQGPNDADEVDADTDDIAVDRIRISTKCPLTLRDFVDPVTSRPCNHSFEREAIYGMIQELRPPTRGARAARENWKAAVRCPVAGCDQLIGKDDLVVDNVLVRRIDRIQRSREGKLEGDVDSSMVGADDVDVDAERSGSGSADEIEDD